MIFKGHIKSSFIDYPDKISTVLFTGGCNFRCPYCHNGPIVNNQGEDITEEYVSQFLSKRKKMLDAVCISGGEPTLHKELYDFIVKIKGLGYLVKLDTNGTNPIILRRLISEGLLDYVAMDIKAPINKYREVTKADLDYGNVKASIDIIMNSGIDYEFRTTICKELLNLKDIADIAEEIKDSKRFIIQNFRDGETILIGENHLTPFLKDELKEIHKAIQGNFSEFKIRNS